MLPERSPDVVLLDLDLGDEDGLDALPRIQAAVPGAKVLILTALKDRARDQAAVRTGARGLVLKDAPADALLEAIRAVAAGELSFDPARAPGAGSSWRSPPSRRRRSRRSPLVSERLCRSSARG